MGVAVWLCAGCHRPVDNGQADESVAVNDTQSGATRTKSEPTPLEECRGQVHLVLLKDASGRRGAPKTQFVDRAFLERVGRSYEERYGIDARVRRPMPLPLSDFDPQRGQYQDERILDRLEQAYSQEIADPDAIVLAVMNQDMYPESIPQWRYAFSMRREDRGLALVSSYRMTSHGGHHGDAAFRHRMRVMLAKDVGRLLCGFDLSDDPTSVMFGKVLGPADLDRMSDDLRTGRQPSQRP